MEAKLKTFLPFPTKVVYEMSVAEIISTYWSLSLTAFGGPNAHIAMFYQLFVEKLNWLSAKKFAELFSISQTLPGPGSTQVGYAIALLHSGFTGAFVQLLLWTLPGTFIMIGFAYGIRHLDNNLPLVLAEILNGLTSAAVGLVALSAFKMGNTIITGKLQVSIATFVSVMAICFSFAWLLPSLMVFGGLITVGEYYLEQRVNRQEHSPLHTAEGTQLEVSNQIEDDEEVDSQEKIWHNHKLGFVFLSIFVALLIAAIVIRSSSAPKILKIWSVMYFVGSIIFGGGTVVIPVLQQYVVGEGWLSDQEFLVGLALINAMPGI